MKQITTVSQETFQDMIKKAYDRGTNEAEITVGQLLDGIIGDLKNIIVK